MVSIVRQNLLTEKNYTPYCGVKNCRYTWPRTKFNGEQFECKCGWKSSFEKKFICEYVEAQKKLKDIAYARMYGASKDKLDSMATPTGRTPSPPNFQNIPGTLAHTLEKVYEREGLHNGSDAMAFNDDEGDD